MNNVFKTIFRAGLISLLFVGTAFGADLPIRPTDAPHVDDRPAAHCGANWGVAYRIYDMNPATEASHVDVVLFEFRDDAPVFGPSIGVILIDDVGTYTYYLKEGQAVKTYTREELGAKYETWCEVDGAKPPKETI